jgi:hypothetical protein
MAFIKGDPNKNLIPVFDPGNEQKDVILIQGPGIVIENLSDVDTYRFRFSTTDITDLSVTLIAVAKQGGVTKSTNGSPLILIGTVIDEVELSWIYNTAAVEQELTNTGGLDEPVLSAGTLLYEYTAQTIDYPITYPYTNLSFTITGNDGLSQPGSIASDTKSLTFGNNLYVGTVSISLSGDAYATLQGLLDAMTKVVKNSRGYTFYPTANETQRQIIAYPKSWGLGQFRKNVGVGGYDRVVLVGLNLKLETEMSELDVESDIMVTNSQGATEAYYVYQSHNLFVADSVTPTILS